MVGFDDGTYVVQGLGERLFTRYPADGRMVRQFGTLFDDQARFSIGLQGELAPTGTGAFIYAPLRAGYLAEYTAEGERRFLVRTIDALPLPKLLLHGRDGGGGIAPESRNQISTRSASAVGDTVFLLTYLREGGNVVAVADAYSAENGAYLGSTRMPDDETTVAIHVTTKYWYTATQTTVSKWMR